MALTPTEINRRFRERHGEKYLVYRREWARKHRQKNLARYRAYGKREREKAHAQNAAFIDSVKERCLHCGITDKRVLTFHHRDPKMKSFPIAIGARHTYSLAKLKAEVAKCDVLCFNCHMILESEARLSRGLDK